VELREKPRFGYRRLHVLLPRTGEAVNRKRVHLVYREAGLEPAAEEAQALHASEAAVAEM
jgi:putative transposase